MDRFFVLQVNQENPRFQTYTYEMERLPKKKFKKYPILLPSSYDGTILTGRIRTRTEMTVMKMKLYRTIRDSYMKDAYMQMLLHLNEDFDDDYLLDCMRVLDQE